MANTINWNCAGVVECLHDDAEKYGDDEYCVYFWQDRMGDVFYVGSGKGYRFKSANPKTRQPEFMEYIDKGGCSPKIVAYGMNKIQSVKFEHDLIKIYWKMGFPLVNREGIAERECEYRQRAEQTKVLRGIRPYMHIKKQPI